MLTQCVFRGCSHSLFGIHAHSMGVQRLFNTTHWHSRVLTSVQGCSVLTQMRSFSWSHQGESHSIMTQWWSCALIRCSHSLNGGHVHSMNVQGLFPLTHWSSCALNGCSRSVQCSLTGVHAHSQVFRSCSIIT